MTNTLKISMKPNEKIYINGAVIRVDRKVTVELLNDVQFLLQNHVIQAEDASTPLKQLYFIVQVMLMNPSDAAQAREMFRQRRAALAGWDFVLRLTRRFDKGTYTAAAAPVLNTLCHAEFTQLFDAAEKAARRHRPTGDKTEGS